MSLIARGKYIFTGLLPAVLFGSSLVLAEEFIGGTTPSVRPARAPVIETFAMTREDEKTFFHGVSKPYPPSLMFVNKQGAWFTPFSHPGMSGKYDLRDWHN